MIAVRHQEAQRKHWPFDANLARLNIAIALLVYFAFITLLLYSLIGCYAYLSTAEQNARRRPPSPFNTMAATSNAAPAPRTQNAIAMKPIRRASSRIKFTAEQLRMRNELLAAQRGCNTTGSLQQLATPGAFSREDSRRRLSGIALKSPMHELSAPNLRTFVGNARPI